MSEVEDAILTNLKAFIAFVRKRVGDPHLAEDIVQESLAKALAAERKPTDAENTVAWFYRILRRSIIDLHRRRDVRSRALNRLEQELPEAPSDADERLLCQCFRRLLPSLPPGYQELLQQIDLEDRDPAEVATVLGVTRNNLTVRLHRARKQLRDKLAQNCRACSKHGCLDCTCGEPGSAAHAH